MTILKRDKTENIVKASFLYEKKFTFLLINLRNIIFFIKKPITFKLQKY